MKKIYIFVIIILIFLFGCNSELVSEDELIKKARTEINIAENETIDLQIAGFVDENESRFIWFIAGNKDQGYTYVPMEFKKNEKNELSFIKTCMQLERYEDISILKLSSGYSFLVNNEQCKYIYIVKENENQTLIEVKEIPFLYYYKIAKDSNFNYYFLDENKNELE